MRFGLVRRGERLLKPDVKRGGAKQVGSESRDKPQLAAFPAVQALKNGLPVGNQAVNVGKHVFLLDLVRHVLLEPRDEHELHVRHFPEQVETDVAPVHEHYRAREQLPREIVQHPPEYGGVVLASRRHLHDGRYQPVMVQQRMGLGRPFPVVEPRPVEKRQAERYDGGIDAEHLPLQPVRLTLAVQFFRKRGRIRLEELAEYP